MKFAYRNVYEATYSGIRWHSVAWPRDDYIALSESTIALDKARKEMGK